MTAWASLAAAAWLSAAWAGEPAARAHPLDPLSAAEIARAAGILRADPRVPKEAFFPSIVLEEPPKEAPERRKLGAPPRRAFAVVLDRAAGRTHEAWVDLSAGRLERLEPRPGVQPALMPEETSAAPELVRADPRWQAAMRLRGISDFTRVGLDAWAPGTIGLDSAGGPRLARVLSFYKGRSSNYYARPIEGVIAVVDLAAGKVLRVEDSGAVALSSDDGAYDAASVSAPKRAQKPFEVRQPSGPGFALQGREVRWRGWSFRFALHPREGPVVYDVRLEDGERSRKVLHRASVSEMVVPYGDPSPNWSWRAAFDAGELGVGKLASPLERGSDVPDNTTLLDAVLADEHGSAVTLKRALALYERDGGLLWRHYTLDPESRESRRGRELVLGSIVTIGNYDYGLNWVFREDGSLEFQVELTGIMLAKGVLPSEPAGPYAHSVSSGVAAPHHQHFFNLRLDFDVDGPENSVYEASVRPTPSGPENPRGNAFAMGLRPLRTEREARARASPEENRRWLVASAASAAHGHPAGFLLVPGENTVPYAQPDSPVRRRAGFLDHHFWATRFKPEERYAAGDYPNQSEGGDGLARWSGDESLERQDLVVWYTLGVTHTPRPEEWPVMPAHRGAVRLIPAGFFRRNPALGIPRAPAP